MKRDEERAFSEVEEEGNLVSRKEGGAFRRPSQNISWD
jgi:hypothetical protein